MVLEEYLKAQKMAQKAFKNATSKGRYPYLPVLDEILSHAETEGEVYLGVMEIPLYQVVGTSTFGRTQAFATNYMPLLKADSEFAAKWVNLYQAQLDEGIHDAVKVYEYMNRYYVEEGNKRVSVLKYVNAPSILANVYRKVPKLTDDLETQIYYEFMDFFEKTRIPYVKFSELGSYEKLMLEVNGNTNEWNEEQVRDFNSFHLAFFTAFENQGGEKLDFVNCDDALIYFLSLYPFEESKNLSSEEIDDKLKGIWAEFELLDKEDSVELLMDPTEEKKIVSTVLSKITNRKKKIAFIYDKEPEESEWIYSHELGRLHIEDAFGRQIETSAHVVYDYEDGAEKTLRDVCENGTDIVFVVTPQLVRACVKVAADYSNVHILNCSLNSSHNTIRTYYARMYEAKFLTGVIAGAMCKNDRLGYVAGYPIYGSVANINAFALGARMTNPRVKVYVAWSSVKNFDIEGYFKENEISYISGQDMITPGNKAREFGLYKEKHNHTQNLATSLCHWGAMYEEIINSIYRGGFEADESSEDKALNYWWGLSAGVVDVITSTKLDSGLTKLVSLLKKNIKKGVFHPFTGPIADQDGEMVVSDCEIVSPQDIITMDWFVENVVGVIPTLDELSESAKQIVRLRGLDATNPDMGGKTLL